MKRFTVLLVLSIVFAMLAVGVVAAEGPEYGGTMTVGMISDPDSLNPFISNRIVGSWVLNNIYPTLLVMDEEANKVSYLTEEVKTSEDGKTVTVKLKDGLTWQDGEPLTSADVKYTYETLYEQKLQWQADVFDYVDSMETPDDTTIVFNLNQSYPAFFGTIGFWQRIVPEHVFAEVGGDMKQFTNPDPVGFGPFKLTDYKQGQYYIVERVDNYFDGRPYLDKIVYRIYPDVNTMVLALKRGEIDLTLQPIPHATAEELKGDPDFTVVQNTSLGFYYLGFNYKNEFLQDKSLRQALAYAVDRKKIIAIALNGDGIEIDTPISPVYQDVVNPDAKLPDFDPEKARELLEAAGYGDTDGNGVLNSPGGDDVVLELLYAGNNMDHKKVAQILAANFNDAGIKLVLTPKESNTVSDLVFNQQKFDINLSGWGILDEPSDYPYTLYHSTSYLNFMGLKSDTLDKYIEGARFATSPEEIKENLFKLQEEFLDEMPLVTLYVNKFNYAYNNRFTGFRVFPSDLKALIDPQSASEVYLKE